MLLDQGGRGPRDQAEAALKSETAESFGYEWDAFGGPRPEWRRNFVDYMQPHPLSFFEGKSVLDVGTGSGRHAGEAARQGARVVAVDLGDAIDVARRNVPPEVMTVQADAEALPFAPASFDFVMSIGVLHHLPDTGRALRALVPFAKPGGRVHVYLYWWPTRRSHRLILRGVSMARRLTTQMPHRLLHAACYPLAALLFIAVVLPYRLLRRFPRLEPIADALPLKIYADYPFGVLVNDQFDRFSAPIERRFTREQAERLMVDAGLEDVRVLPNHGWVCDGRRPAASATAARPSAARLPASGEAPPVALEAGDPRDAVPVLSLSAVAAQSPVTPSFRIRVLLVADELARHGVNIDPQPLLSRDEERRFREGSTAQRARVAISARSRLLRGLQQRGDGFDATLIQRQVDLLPTLQLERAAADGRPLIWDVDDAIWHETSREVRQHPLAVLKGIRRKVDWLIDRADHVIAGNRILAEWLGERADNVSVIPSVVETRAITPRRHHDGNEITIGWIGSPPTAPYLAAMRPLLARLARERRDTHFRLLLVGGVIADVEGMELEQRAWSPGAERDALAEIDIGLMPLPDTPWTRGKCSYKAVQYMAGGVPTVADDVGITREVIADGGHVVNGADAWMEALDTLARDGRLRERIGSGARARAEAHFSVQRWGPRLAEILRDQIS